ncbi:hypothetical protein HDEF_1206 [Candidatus Hamiltonella defensa 5AT (Acyrthosiphon pisum)]|uniref:Uncharacterized protein n=1 Tax=Hamiltonella defensa subsp. Acyrthosiphon pisum (strain 5AT) TaxID=572265 RepID=C4K5M2_HAMD5|nr:hypothetical protein HDEF_1206 [Candidatus Hamiltonella defensa 5AT (Acyrthosiphon pisum)]
MFNDGISKNLERLPLILINEIDIHPYVLFKF